MYFDFKRGITREVLIIGKIVIKFPSIRTYMLFLKGLSCNSIERNLYKIFGSNMLCPVWFKFPFGLFIVMPRCSPTNFKDYYDTAYNINIGWYRYSKIPVECKPCSFGWYKDRLVAVDYGL